MSLDVTITYTHTHTYTYTHTHTHRGSNHTLEGDLPECCQGSTDDSWSGMLPYPCVCVYICVCVCIHMCARILLDSIL